MESLIYRDSPLAEFLEGTAVEGDTDPTPQPTDDLSELDGVSFAPRGPPTGHARFRRKAQKEQANIQLDRISELYQRCKSIITSKLAPDNSKFLERFRYILVTSQLLSDHATTQGYNPRLCLMNATTRPATVEFGKPTHTPQGTAVTAAGAFTIAWFIHWVRTLANGRPVWYKLCMLSMVFSVISGIGIVMYRWQRRTSTQRNALQEATSMVGKAQELDAVTAGAISLVQEVELVSRGYRISSPLPPISQLEDQGQMKRCERLRRALRKSVDSIVTPYAKAYNYLRDQAVELDLERYHDIYEISRMDIEEVEALAHGGAEDFGDPEALKSLKISLQRLHTSRKLFLCCLLTIPFMNRTRSLSTWTYIVKTIHGLAAISSKAASDIGSILSEETKPPVPLTPLKSPLSPGRERLHAQTRKFAGLAQGTRELQAKLYLLREDCDRAISAPSNDLNEDSSSKLLEQYDAFGVDLKALVQEWENGRTALVAALDRHNDRRISMASSGPGLAHSRSTTPSSLSGLTTAGNSPAEALKILNGEALSAIDSHSSDEEVFEAIAMPRARSMLTRDERIKKMHVDRAKQVERREQADETRRMVKELESVIKLRPAPKRGMRVTSM